MSYSKIVGSLLTCVFSLSVGTALAQNEGYCGWVNPSTKAWEKLGICQPGTKSNRQSAPALSHQGQSVGIAYNVMVYPGSPGKLVLMLKNVWDKKKRLTNVTITFGDIKDPATLEKININGNDLVLNPKVPIYLTAPLPQRKDYSVYLVVVNTY